MKQGWLVSISAPSGGGKTTVVNELLKQVPHSIRLMTCTTRAYRAIDGADYHFLTKSEFVHKIVVNGFLEHVQFAGNYYGTDRAEVEHLLATNDFVFALVDVRGAESYQAFPYKQKRIFLQPENLEVLRTRLARRPGITEAEIQRRLTYAEQEIAAGAHFDAVIVNREGYLAETIAKVKEILVTFK